MSTDDDELTRRATWVLDRLRELIDADEKTRRLGPAADAAHLKQLRDQAGEIIDVARHLAADPRLDGELRARYRRVVKWLNETYASWSEIHRFLRWQEGGARTIRFLKVVVLLSIALCLIISSCRLTLDLRLMKTDSRRPPGPPTMPYADEVTPQPAPGDAAR
jgi:hypothetical protein